MAAHLRIAHKGVLIVCIPLAFSVIFMSLMVLLLNQINEEILLEERTRDVLATTNDFGRLLINSSALIAALSLQPEAGMQGRLDELLNGAQQDLDELKVLLKANPGELARIETIEKSFDSAKANFRNFSERADASSSLFLIYTNPQIRKSLKSIGAINSSIQQLISEQERRAAENLSKVEHSKRRIETALLSGLIVSVSLTLCLTVFFVRNIVRRIQALVENAESLGSRQSLIHKVAGHDDLSELDAALHRVDLELKQLEKARQNLIIFVGHELRTPLTSLSSVFSLLADGFFMPLAPAAKNLAHTAFQSLSEVNDLISDLIDIEKMQGGKFELFLSDVDVPTFTDSIVEKCFQSEEPDSMFPQQRLISEPRRQFQLDRVDDLLITADKDRLSRALVNVLRSALKRSREPVKIVVGEQAGWIDFSFTFAGVPLEKALLNCIFSRNQFSAESYSLNSYLSEAVPLITSRLILEAHGGILSIKSESGVPAVFLCRLPLTREHKV